MRRPFHTMAALMQATHQAVELGLGTGVIGQAQAGLPGAIGLSALMISGWTAAATRRRAPERLLSYGAGIAVGVPFIHFTLWPWAARFGVPVLTEAEGLPPSAMGVYNGILYAWAGAGLLALLRETPRRHWPWMLVGFASVIGFRPVARQHFAWIASEGRRNPQWWNRAWASEAGGR